MTGIFFLFLIYSSLAAKKAQGHTACDENEHPSSGQENLLCTPPRVYGTEKNNAEKYFLFKKYYNCFFSN